MFKRSIAAMIVLCLLATFSFCTYAATVSQTNAIKSAQNYLSFTAFSRSGLISQLEYEGFSTSDATYGVDNCGADWNKQAVRSAENYLSFTAFSERGLINQLKYEGFTNEQAEYGVKNCGADWFEQAVLSGKNQIMLIEHLEKYTHGKPTSYCCQSRKH